MFLVAVKNGAVHFSAQGFLKVSSGICDLTYSSHLGRATDETGNGLLLTRFSKDNSIDPLDRGKGAEEMLLFLCYLQEGCLGTDHYLR